MLTERLLQFIWQFQYFNTQFLFTTSGEPLQILHAGTFNQHQGPDFLDGKIKTNNTIWAGNIEIHLAASDWVKHQHQQDEKYQNVILHVVWKDDIVVKDKNGKAMATLLLEPLVPAMMMAHYETLMHAGGFVPCQSFLPKLSPLGWHHWLERMLIERLQKRSELILQKLAQNHHHWEEAFWHLLCRNFGAPVNADAFESVAQSIPLQILAKHKSNIHQLEALLLGQAGLLHDEFTDEYPLLLQREYSFLKNKFKLTEAAIKPVFLRMRPSNFPTVRLAQLAMLVHQSEHLFSKILEAKSNVDVAQWLTVTANDFWHYHYRLQGNSGYKPKMLGEQMAETILINTVVPVVFAYGVYHNNQGYKDKAIEWLTDIKTESNTIIKSWRTFGVPSENALQSQGLLELKKWYCDARKCLDCAVGNKILKTNKDVY